MKSIDKYLFQAMDSYPYCLEETIESLEYALSYDSRNTTALCLYARIQAEQLFNYEEAKRYFQEALSINIYAIEIYPFYIQTLLWNEDFEEASKLIDFALTIKGINKAEILMKKIQFLEIKREFKKLKKIIKKMKLNVVSNDYHYAIAEIEKRIKDKTEILKPKKDKKVKEKKKTKKKKEVK